MKLIKFHVGNATTCTPGHGYPIARSDIRVTGIEIDLTGSSCGQNGKARSYGFDLAMTSLNT